MKRRDITELHTKTEVELRAMLKEMRGTLISARLDQAQQKLSNTTSLTNLRADIARVLTVLNMKANDVKQIVEGGKE